MAAPNVEPVSSQEDDGDCAEVSAFMLGEVLALEYTAVFDNGNCVAVQTLVHFGDDGTATEITSA